MSLKLPSQANIRLSIDNGTQEDYHLVRLYYSWYSGWFYRNRLRLADQLLQGTRVHKMLEIGTGSGIFIKQLLEYTDHLTGIDIHESYSGIQKMLKAENIDPNRVDLHFGSILEIPHPDASFGAVVCISVLEHFADPLPALSEISRVLEPGGTFIAGFPANTPLTRALFGALGYQAEEIHPGTHEKILDGLQQIFQVEAIKPYPFNALKMYIVCKLTKKT